MVFQSTLFKLERVMFARSDDRLAALSTTVIFSFLREKKKKVFLLVPVLFGCGLQEENEISKNIPLLFYIRETVVSLTTPRLKSPDLTTDSRLTCYKRLIKI